MNDDQYRDFAVSRASGGTTSGAMVRGLAANLAFAGVAVILTAIGYVYGALLDISPEFPFVLTRTFMLGAVVVLVLFPLVGVLVSRAGFGLVNTRTAMAAGAGFGAASMAIVWLVTSGPGIDPYDWPELLYLLQLTLSGVVAGTILFSRFDSYALGGTDPADGRIAIPMRERTAIPTQGTARKGRKVFLATAMLFLLAMSVPFLLMWQARRGFQEEAQEQASGYFRLPAGFSMAVTDESSGFGSLEKNVRYRAAGVQDEAGRLFSVDIIGERNAYEVDIREIYASVRVPAADIPVQVEWNDSEAGRRTQEAVLDLASAYVNTPLKIVSVQSDGPSGKLIVMRGDGLQVVARPGGTSSEASGAHLTFTATAR